MPFAIRKVKKGRVKIHGRLYEPKDNIPYDGSLDGMRYAFGLYSDPSYVVLWGTEEAYRYKGPEENAPWPGPECVEGLFRWIWWEEVKSK